MKATNNSKRFTTTEIVTYRKSNSTRNVSFDTVEEVEAHIASERAAHPRSKKFNAYYFDTVERRRILA